MRLPSPISIAQVLVAGAVATAIPIDPFDFEFQCSTVGMDGACPVIDCMMKKNCLTSGCTECVAACGDSGCSNVEADCMLVGLVCRCWCSANALQQGSVNVKDIEQKTFVA